MRNAINKFKRDGFKFSKSKLGEQLIYYIGLRSRSIFELADKGYQTSPCVFDEISFRTYILKSHPEIKKYFVGSYDDSFKLKHIKLAILKTEDEELKHALQLYYNILVSEHFIALSKRINDNVGFKRSKDITEVKSRLCINGKIDNYGKIPLEDEMCYKALYVPDGKVVKCINYNVILRKNLLEQLGVKDDNNEAKFIKGVSLDDELELFDFILSGCCECDGEYGQLLQDDIARHVKSYKEKNSSALVVPEYSCGLFTKSIEEITKFTSEIIESENGEYFFITNSCIYYTVDSDIKENKYFKDGVLNVGAYCVDTYNRVELPKIANLMGLCGEFYPANMLYDDALSNNGNSFKFATYNGKKKPLVYEYESSNDICYSNGGASIKPLIPDISSIKFRTDNVDWWTKVKSKAESLLIAELTNALICCEYGSFVYKPVELTDFNITDEQFMYASFRAEELFHSLGF